MFAASPDPEDKTVTAILIGRSGAESDIRIDPVNTSSACLVSPIRAACGDSAVIRPPG